MSDAPLLPFAKGALPTGLDSSQLDPALRETEQTKTASGSLTTEEAAPSRVVGTIAAIQFRNADTGFTVLKITPKDGSREISVVGPSIQVAPGDHVLANGRYVTHPKYGRQFKADIITTILPTCEDGLVRYLASGAIKGIGPSLAQKIVSHFGEDTDEILKTAPERLKEVPGIGTQKAAVIAKTFGEEGELQAILQFLTTHRLSLHLAHKIYRSYGSRAVDRLSADPYILARDLKGVGFRKADMIATAGLGIALDSPLRIKAALLYALEEASRKGHCFLNYDELLSTARNLVSDFAVSRETFERLVTELGMGDHVRISNENHIYLTALHDAESFTAECLLRRKLNNCEALVSDAWVDAIAQAEEALHLHFSPEQRYAIETSMREKLLVITGGPGCGKTTLVRAIVSIALKLGRTIKLAAPTGKAAHRLASVCNYHASTIHRLLKYQDGRFTHGPDDPIEADIVLVDEASMLDIRLSAALFSSIPHKATLILVGDKDQLPSVGPGRVFADIVESNNVPLVTLTKIYRQAEESEIIAAAHAINTGKLPQMPYPDGTLSHQVYFLERQDPERVGSLVERLMCSQIPEKFGYSLENTMLLTPTNVGPLGTDSLNTRLQRALNPRTDSKQEIKIGETIFREGDRVCHRRNNYTIHDQGVFNGDTGTIKSIDKQSQKATVELWDGRLINYTENDLSELSLAYAWTVHRSQGSEAPCVLLVLHHSSFLLLERQLIYTAVTRAQELLIVVGSQRGLQLSCERNSAKVRNSGLKLLLSQTT